MKRSRAGKHLRGGPRSRREAPQPEAGPAAAYAPLLAALRKAPGPVSIPQLARQLSLEPEAEPALRRQMEFLERRGVVFSQRRGRWALHARAHMAVGRYHSPRGTFGFVVRNDGGGEDLFIPPRAGRGAAHGDTVLARVTAGGRRADGRRTAGRRRAVPGGPSGEVVAVLERRAPGMAALYHAGPGGGTIVPRDERLGPPMAVADPPDGIPDGAIVWAERLGPGDRFRPPGARIVSVLGSPEDPEVRHRVIRSLYDLPGPFPADAEREAAALPDALDAGDRAGREDFTGAEVVTIDPEGARDHDDAVGLEIVETPRGGLFRLWVHIADVARYVPPDSAMDREALRRGTSVYFPDRHIPMLPMRLSSGLCSLKADEDRLTQSVVMDFDMQGEPAGFRFCDGVIRSRADLTYERALALMEGRPAPARDEPLRALLVRMKALSRALRARRLLRGSLDLDLPETRIDVDAQGRPVGLRAAPHTIAHQAIEEFMLAANETVAGWLSRHSHSTLYRIHEDPDPAEIDQMEEELLALGFPLKRARGSASARLKAVLEQSRDAVEQPAIAMMVLRTLKLARYSHEAIGHFGLAAPLYTHFTSPLRRYPDLVVHRVLREARKSPAPSTRGAGGEMDERLASVALESSTLERRAEEAERAMEAWQEAIYMKGRIGEAFDGLVTGRTERAVFVTLEGLGVEGLVPLRPRAEAASPHRTARRPARKQGRGRQPAAVREEGWRLGDRLRVVVQDVDTFRARILLRPLQKD